MLGFSRILFFPQYWVSHSLEFQSLSPVVAVAQTASRDPQAGAVLKPIPHTIVVPRMRMTVASAIDERFGGRFLFW